MPRSDYLFTSESVSAPVAVEARLDLDDDGDAARDPLQERRQGRDALRRAGDGERAEFAAC